MEKTTKDNIINLLWTGGWDSTFSLLLLLDKDVIIQPYYIVDSNRSSNKKEIETMDKIRAAIESKYTGRKQTLLPTIYTNLQDISIDEEIYNKWLNLRWDTGLGTQYYWLASFAKNTSIADLQMAVVKDGRISKLLEGYAKKVSNGVTNPYWVAPGIPDNIDISIFSRFQFPIMEYTKVDMLNEAKKEGFLDILNLSWFCHKPIKGKPCGICNPCLIAAEEGLAERLPPEAIRRQKYLKFYRTYYKVIKKLKNIRGRSK